MSEHYTVSQEANGDPTVRLSWDNEFKERPYFMELGATVPVEYDDPDVELAVDRAIELGRKDVRRGLIFEIRAMQPPWTGKSNYGREWLTARQRNKAWGVAWYFNIDLTADPAEWRKPIREAEVSELGGYMIIARVRS